jgi:rod shape determining protein RodA
VLLITASLLVRSEIGTVKQSLGVLGKLALAVGVPMLLILRQPDLKSAIVLPPMVFSMLYVSRLSGRFFAGALAAFLLVTGLVLGTHGVTCISWTRTTTRSRTTRGSTRSTAGCRSTTTSATASSPSWTRTRSTPWGSAGTSASRSYRSAAAAFTGKGWTEGTQARLGYLPRSVAHNDFIFSVIAEEKGFLGSITVLSLFGLMLFNGIRIAGLSRDRFGTLLALGVTVLFLVHVFVNIAMTIGLVPITGIPLPFISYGGTFVLSCCLLQGLVQSVYRFRKDFA